MLFKTMSAAVYGIDASIIEVEVDVSGIKTSEDHFHTVGLPDAAVRESRERIRSALRNCGYDVPPTHITINLAPADIKKEGSGFDLPMALGILGAYGALNKKEFRNTSWSANSRSTAACAGPRGVADRHRRRARQDRESDRSGSERARSRRRERGECLSGEVAASTW